MIESQLRPNNIIDENLITAFQKVKQENFLPEELKKLSYIDDHISFKASYFCKVFKYFKTRIVRSCFGDWIRRRLYSLYFVQFS